MVQFSGYVIVSGNGDLATRLVSNTEIDAWISVFGNDARRIHEGKIAGHRAVEVEVLEAEDDPD